jgi:hypothetical protein
MYRPRIDFWSTESWPPKALSLASRLCRPLCPLQHDTSATGLSCHERNAHNDCCKVYIYSAIPTY